MVDIFCCFQTENFDFSETKGEKKILKQINTVWLNWNPIFDISQWDHWQVTWDGVI